MIEPIYYDTETCGLHGPIVLIQYSEGFGDVVLFEPWTNPIHETLELINRFMLHPGGVIGFNLAFDHFHLNQLYNTFNLFPDHNAIPEDYIDELAILEEKARDGLCLKPVKCLDIMLHARKGPYQSTMDRGDIRVKKVPAFLAWPLAQELERRVKLKDIYFAKKKNKYTPQWNVYEIDDEPEFRDVVLKFHPSNALKALAVDALGIQDDELLLYGDISLSGKDLPEENGFAPFAMSIGRPGRWNNTWPAKIQLHIDHWATHKTARRYATNDVLYTRELHKYFGMPDLGDDDSELACLVGSARWKGFCVNIEGIKQLRQKALEAAAKVPTAPEAVRKYIYFHLSQTERIVLQEGSRLDETTDKLALKEIADFKIPCPSCNTEILEKSCETCENSGEIFHPAAIKAQEVLDARNAKEELKLYDKLINAGRLHASFNVIGTLSSRMSGSDKLNAQGIKKAKFVRSQFPLAFPDRVLCGGDFKSFEVVLADACYSDPELRKELLTVDPCPFCEAKGCKECEGTGKLPRSIHAIFGTFCYPGKSYLDILLTKGTTNDLYTKAKSAVFAMLYGGEAYTLKTRLGVPIEVAERAYQMFVGRYKKVGLERKRITDMFCSMRQLDLHGKVEWHTPADYIESGAGFRRYFTLENSICEALYKLAEKPPKAWTELKINITRRDREQTISGAVRSALFAAAFALQASNMRAAANHVIQSWGAQITKRLQRRIWNVQPIGVSEWVVQPMNIHDEIMVAAKPEVVSQVHDIVNELIEECKTTIPLIGIDWSDHLTSWADK